MREHSAHLEPYLSRAEAWSLALGTSIGWGSLVITCSTYLASAGPAGTVLGLLIGTAVMLMVASTYAFLMRHHPDAGGAFTYAKEIFGPDFGVLASWFVILTYFAMLWANATSLPLFARYFVGNVFQVGKLFEVFGYEVYLGEVLLSVGAILLTCLVCARHKKFPTVLNTCLAATFSVGIVACFVSALTGHTSTSFSLSPAYAPNGSALAQVVRIASISPWAFIGFENISNSTEELGFSTKHSFGVLTAAVLTSTVLYVAVTLLSISAYPPQYDSWVAYIADLPNLGGLEGLPAFYAARHYLGSFGVSLLGAALLSLVVTSLVGNTIALSRLFFALARDRVLPARFAKLGRQGIPSRAFVLVAMPSVIVPLLGRTTVGWIVDVTTLGATLIYGIVAGSALRVARQEHNARMTLCARACLAMMVLFGALLLLPNLLTTNTLAPETFFIFTSWSVLGFFLFEQLQKRDKQERFGQTAIVWISLLTLILFSSIAWMSRASYESSNVVVDKIHAFLNGDADVMAYWYGEDAFIETQKEALRSAYAQNAIFMVGLFALSIIAWVRSFSRLRIRIIRSEKELVDVKSIAYVDLLTGVRSRHAYGDRVASIDVTIKMGEMNPFGIVLCDLNGLKFVNDTQGHQAGDEYIRTACRVICELYDHSPVFRLGGDEFVVLLENRDYEKRDELLARLNDYNEKNIGTSQPTIAAGMATFDELRDASVHDVLKRADARMYEHKRAFKERGEHVRD